MSTSFIYLILGLVLKLKMLYALVDERLTTEQENRHNILIETDRQFKLGKNLPKSKTLLKRLLFSQQKKGYICSIIGMKYCSFVGLAVNQP